MQLEFNVKNLTQECKCLQALQDKCRKIKIKVNDCVFRKQKYKIYRSSSIQKGEYQHEFLLFLSRIPHKYSIKFRENLEIANVYRKRLGITDVEYNLLDLNQVVSFVNDLKHEFEAIIRARSYQYTIDLYTKTILNFYYNKLFIAGVDVSKINPLISFNKDFLPLQQCFDQALPSIDEKFIIFMPAVCKDITKTIIIYETLSNIINKK